MILALLLSAGPANGPFGPLIGKLADRHRRSRLIPAGLVIAALSAGALAPQLPLVLAGIAVTMLSLGYDLTQPLLAGIVTTLGGKRAGLRRFHAARRRVRLPGVPGRAASRAGRAAAPVKAGADDAGARAVSARAASPAGKRIEPQRRSRALGRTGGARLRRPGQRRHPRRGLHAAFSPLLHRCAEKFASTGVFATWFT